MTLWGKEWGLKGGITETVKKECWELCGKYHAAERNTDIT